MKKTSYKSNSAKINVFYVMQSVDHGCMSDGDKRAAP